LGSIVLFITGEFYYAFLYQKVLYRENYKASLILQHCIRYTLIFWLGTLDAVLWTMLLALVIQLLVGELRPDFLDRVSREDANLVYSGRLSFPSGHTSASFAWATFISLYAFQLLFVQFKPSKKEGIVDEPLSSDSLSFSSALETSLSHPSSPDTSSCLYHLGQWLLSELKYISSSTLVMLPFLLALLVGISRIYDHRHHAWDVVGGAVLGMSVASLVFFRIWFSYMPRNEHMVKLINQVHLSSVETWA
jgi:membrane-associated phospholipid phosphatase